MRINRIFFAAPKFPPTVSKPTTADVLPALLVHMSALISCEPPDRHGVHEFPVANRTPKIRLENLPDALYLVETCNNALHCQVYF